MKKIVVCLLVFMGFLTFAGNKRQTLDNPVFVFNNALNQPHYPVLSLEQQAVFVKKMGFDGMECKETVGLLETVDLFKKQGLKIYANYVKIDLDAENSYLPSWKEVLPKLNGTGMILWLHIHSVKYKPSDEAADPKIVAIVRELADLAKPYGVRIAIYHHVAFVVEKAEDSFRIAQKAERENVGSVFNLCHFLKTDSEENLRKVIDLTFPKLFAVSIAGANSGDTKAMNWDKLIQPVGEGSFDTYRLLELLKEKGYDGPVGIQCYAIKEMPQEHLPKSMKAIAGFRERHKIPNNELTKEEKNQSWQLLFDGRTTKNWRGINLKTFPSTGWRIQNGDLIADVEGGAESGNGGDVITQKRYGKFILKWEWQMLSKGGNSGVKYFVQEGIGDNKGYGFGLEYQLLDDKYHAWMLSGKMKPNDYHTLGSLYELYPASTEKQASPLGLWNESKIVCQGNQVEHWLNGRKILQYDRSSPDFKARIASSKFKDTPGYGVLPEGHILLQDHGSVIHYRNIKIREFK